MTQAKCEWNLSSVEESGLNSVVFAGMCVGAPVWGMVSDTWGRKTAFFLATLISGVFGFATALAPNFHVSRCAACRHPSPGGAGARGACQGAEHACLA
jgi:MFS family permease